MNLAYAGTHRFAVFVLEHLLKSSGFRERHRIVGYLTVPDRPRGRHGTPQPSPLKERVADSGLPLWQPEVLGASLANEVRAQGASVLVACAYGRLLPAEVLQVLSGIVVHPSLVPRWRGASPVERALMAGETELGVSILRMSAGVDEGPVAVQRPVHVPREADAGLAYELLAAPAAAALTEVLDDMERGSVTWSAQVGESTYAAKLGEADRQVDWQRPATAIADQVRALAPAIGAVAQIGGRRVLLWKVRPLTTLPEEAGPDRLVLPTGDGWIEVLELQAAGRRRMTAAEYLRGARRLRTQT